MANRATVAGGGTPDVDAYLRAGATVLSSSDDEEYDSELDVANPSAEERRLLDACVSLDKGTAVWLLDDQGVAVDVADNEEVGRAACRRVSPMYCTWLTGATCQRDGPQALHLVCSAQEERDADAADMVTLLVQRGADVNAGDLVRARWEVSLPWPPPGGMLTCALAGGYDAVTLRRVRRPAIDNAAPAQPRGDGLVECHQPSTVMCRVLLRPFLWRTLTCCSLPRLDTRPCERR